MNWPVFTCRLPADFAYPMTAPVKCEGSALYRIPGKPWVSTLKKPVPNQETR